MSRYDQIIGRAVRDGSHKNLPLSERNVFIHNLILINESSKKFSFSDVWIKGIRDKKKILLEKMNSVFRDF